jgi:hypothetical protein
MVNFAQSSRPARPYLTIVLIDEKLIQPPRIKKGMGIIFNNNNFQPLSVSITLYSFTLLLFVTKFKTIHT